MKIIIAQSAPREPFTRRHIDTSAKAAWDPESHIVHQNDHYIGCSLGSAKHCLLRSVGIARVKRNRPVVWLIGNRQDLASYLYILCHCFVLLYLWFSRYCRAIASLNRSSAPIM